VTEIFFSSEQPRLLGQSRCILLLEDTKSALPAFFEEHCTANINNNKKNYPLGNRIIREEKT